MPGGGHGRRVEELVAALELVRSASRARSAAPRAPSALHRRRASAPPAEALDRPAAFDRLTATMGARFVVELIDTFVEDARELIGTLRRALAEADVDAFRRAAHSLKSTSESLGATPWPPWRGSSRRRRGPAASTRSATGSSARRRVRARGPGAGRVRA